MCLAKNSFDFTTDLVLSYLTHLDDEEVEDGAAGGHRSEFLASHVDLLLHFGGDDQLVVDDLRRVLGLVQDGDQALVVDQRAHRRRQPRQQTVLELFDEALVLHHRLEDEHALRLQFGAFGRDDARQQLVLQTALRHREVDDGHFRAHLQRQSETSGPSNIEISPQQPKCLLEPFSMSHRLLDTTYMGF